MPDHVPVPVHASLDLTALLLETDTLHGFLEALAGVALAMASTAGACGITLHRQGRPLTVASSGDSARRLDEKQYDLDDGPCLQALREGEEVMVYDMLDEKRWGPYPAEAAACGALSSLSLPIAAHTDSAGALNMYSPQRSGFAEVDLAPLRALAAQATGAIALAQRLADAKESAQDMQAALRSRPVIDQAMGIVMGHGSAALRCRGGFRRAAGGVAEPQRQAARRGRRVGHQRRRQTARRRPVPPAALRPAAGQDKC